MRYTLLRNATALLEYGANRILIDPSLDPAGTRLAIANTANQRPNPLVDLPEGWRQTISALDACLVTHLHQDHFDATARDILPSDTLMLSQPEDVSALGERGFSRVTSVDPDCELRGISIHRTPASHGRGDIARAMAPVSGYVLRTEGEPCVYIAGDTIWYEDVARVIADEQPDVIVLNASGASFLQGGPIVMNAEDIAEVRKAVPHASIVVVHLEAINHCHETRAYYRQRLPELGVDMANVFIPDDGEMLEFSATT